MDCVRRFDLEQAENYYFDGNQIPGVYGLIRGRGGGRGGLIELFCWILTNDVVNKRRGYVKQIVGRIDEEKEEDAMNCLRILYLKPGKVIDELLI